MNRKNIAAALIVVGLLGLFIAAGGLLYSRLRGFQASGSGRAVDYVGDWECSSVSLDVHIEAQGDRLVVSGLEPDPVTFERANSEAPYQQRGGGRQLLRQWKRLQLRQPDGQPLEFRLRQPNS